MSAKPVYRVKPNAIQTLFGRRQAVIGMIHLRPLPGAPEYDGESVDAILGVALAEVARYRAAGVDGLMVENHGDIPFAKPDEIGPETVAAMAVMTQEVRKASGMPVGVNMLANGAIAGLAVAKAAGASFIRVNQWANAYVANEGLMDGKAGAAMRYRSFLRGRDIKVFADVHVKHGAHAITGDRGIGELARDVEFFDADAAIATGCSLPVLVGSGVTADNIAAIFTVADAVIVASSLKRDGVWWNEVDADRLAAFMAAVARARAG